MNRIIKIGMDVHSTNYTLCAMEPVIGEEDRIFATIHVEHDSQKGIMIGRKGQMLKTIGMQARTELEKMLEKLDGVY